jgi:hypothetical protein
MITLVRGGKMISTIIRWALSRAVALSLVVFGFTMIPSAANADTQVPPPAPVPHDYCGAGDELYIPSAENGSYYRDAVNYDASLAEGAYHPTGGNAYVKIIAEYMVVGPDGWAYNEQHVFEYTFDTSAPNGCAEALDTGKVEVGACNQSTGLTQLTVSLTNTDDTSEIPRNGVGLLAYGTGAAVLSVPVTRDRVLDGQTASWTGGQDASLPVYPGHYVGEFMNMSPHQVLVRDVKFTVPACGSYPLIENDGSSGDSAGGSTGDSTDGSTVLPRAKLKLVKCRTGRVRATFNNKRGNAAARVKLSKKPIGGKAVSRTYKVKAGSVLPVFSSGSNAVFKAFAWNGKTKRWVKRDRLRTPLRSRCG